MMGEFEKEKEKVAVVAAGRGGVRCAECGMPVSFNPDQIWPLYTAEARLLTAYYNTGAAPLPIQYIIPGYPI